MCYTYHYLHHIDVTVFRYFTVYGPAGRPDMCPFRFTQWIHEGRPVQVYGDGLQSRDFTYVDDIARGGDAAHAVARALRRENVLYALSGMAAAAVLAPFLTAVSTAGFWIDEAQPLEDVVALLNAEVVESGANVILSQAKDNTPLAFSEYRADLHVANVFRIYYDARRDPKRGREQAEHLRGEVIGW